MGGYRANWGYLSRGRHRTWSKVLLVAVVASNAVALAAAAPRLLVGALLFAPLLLIPKKADDAGWRAAPRRAV